MPKYTQLECRVYTRQELAQLLSVNINDTKHFKRNVENKLNKWGYSYKYSHLHFEITRAPATDYEKLSEIMYRYCQLDVRIDVISFAVFLYSIVSFPEFSAMPWEERSNWLKAEFNIEVTEKTLRSWAAHLFKIGFIIKDDSKTYWVTGIYRGKKYRQVLDLEDEADLSTLQSYQKTRRELYNQYKHLPRDERWKMIFRSLWDKYHYCVYYCKGLQLAAFSDSLTFDLVQEIVELVNNIAEDDSFETEYVIQQYIKKI